MFNLMNMSKVHFLINYLDKLSCESLQRNSRLRKGFLTLSAQLLQQLLLSSLQCRGRDKVLRVTSGSLDPGKACSGRYSGARL